MYNWARDIQRHAQPGDLCRRPIEPHAAHPAHQVTSVIFNVLTTYTASGVPTTPRISFELDGPHRVAVDAAGKIYVTSNGPACCVTTYTAGGVPTTPTITGPYSPDDAVAVDAAGKIYVTNTGNNTLTTYTATGMSTTPTITGLNGPYGLAVH